MWSLDLTDVNVTLTVHSSKVKWFLLTWLSHPSQTIITTAAIPDRLYEHLYAFLSPCYFVYRQCVYSLNLSNLMYYIDIICYISNLCLPVDLWVMHTRILPCFFVGNGHTNHLILVRSQDSLATWIVPP